MDKNNCGKTTGWTSLFLLDRYLGDYRCGEMATFALAEIIETHWITCKGETTDRYKRRIAVCYAGPYDINAEMVKRGWALAYRRYSKDYVDEEEDAKGRGVGMWAGEFIEPWEWRRKH